MKKIIFTESQIKEICDLYTNKNLSLKQIGEQFNVSRPVITRILNENNITIRRDNHKYIANYRIFQNIDTEEKAYWLGFLAADGCVYVRKQNASVIINISRIDRAHLEKFKNFMQSNVNIIDHIQTEGFSNNTEMSKITFNSKEMAQDCINLGIVPKKSLILKPPMIDEKFYKAYILGYFDGDGSISYSQKEKIYLMSIQGTKETLEWINSILNISACLEKRQQDNKNSYYIRCGGTNKPYNILKELYESSPVHLDRKYDKFLELSEIINSRP